MPALAEILEEDALLRERMAALHEALSDTRSELEVGTLERDAVIAEADRLAPVLELIRLEAAAPKS